MTTIPSSVLTKHNEIADAFIDELGVSLTLVYPQIASECDNCLQDIRTGKSAGIYKSGGPHPFTNYTVCPVCGGEGKTTSANTEDITVRWYENPKKFGGSPTLIKIDDGTVKIIGYLTHMYKFRKAEYFQRNFGGILQKYSSEAAPIVHGLTRNRYFEMLLKRI